MLHVKLSASGNKRKYYIIIPRYNDEQVNNNTSHPLALLPKVGFLAVTCACEEVVVCPMSDPPAPSGETLLNELIGPPPPPLPPRRYRPEPPAQHRDYRFSAFPYHRSSSASSLGCSALSLVPVPRGRCVGTGAGCVGVPSGA